MEKTASAPAKAAKLMEEEGKHHIGDFLPPEELSKFMNKYKVVPPSWLLFIYFQDFAPCMFFLLFSEVSGFF